MNTCEYSIGSLALKNGSIVDRQDDRKLNSIELIRGIKLFNAAVDSLPLEDRKVLTRSLSDCSLKILHAISQKSLFHRIYLYAIQILFTGTTLSRAHTALTQSVDYLIQEGEYALVDEKNYLETAQKYKLPACATRADDVKNPLIYHLRQKLASEWRAALHLLHQGKTIENLEVMDHCDNMTRLSLILVKLDLKFEIPRTINKSELCQNLRYQSLNTVGQFYSWLRSYPTFRDNKWCEEYKTQQEFIEQFYTSGTRPAAWRETHNAIVDLVNAHFDLRNIDSRVHLYFHDTRDIEYWGQWDGYEYCGLAYCKEF